MKKLEKQLKALANRRRLAILSFLKKEKEASVKEIAGEIHLSFKSTSKHLRVLSSVELIESEQKSSQMLYSLASTKEACFRYILSLL